jgi:hypothetical protein
MSQSILLLLAAGGWELRVFGPRSLLVVLLFSFDCSRVLAVEGPTAAGPIGGTDIRSAMLPPPGLYGGAFVLRASTLDFLDGHGETIPVLQDAHLSKELVGPFLFYVPDLKVLGGSVGVGIMVPGGNQCGHLFTDEPRRCTAAVGDPYVEIDWSRYYGTPRPSTYANAYPIFEGLTILVGFGVVIPAGGFTASSPTEQALSIGNNIWDFAPSIAFTYTTPPILAEGTEFSAKLYWNNYLENPTTRYLTADVFNIDFAVSEHIGRFQVGVAGFYAIQLEDDRIAGAPIPPDGRQGAILEIGGVVGYDMPEYASSVKFKAIYTPFAENTVTSWGAVMGWIKKF